MNCTISLPNSVTVNTLPPLFHCPVCKCTINCLIRGSMRLYQFLSELYQTVQIVSHTYCYCRAVFKRQRYSTLVHFALLHQECILYKSGHRRSSTDSNLCIERKEQQLISDFWTFPLVKGLLKATDLLRSQFRDTLVSM